jgi:hypothetical protein
VAIHPDWGQLPSGEGLPGGPSGGGDPGIVPASQPQRRRRRGRWLGSVVLLAGCAALVVSGYQVYSGTRPRTFTPSQQRQIMGWEVAARWRQLPAGTIFPASMTYSPPPALADGGKLTLSARRLAIATQKPCPQATDQAAAAIFGRTGCEAVLRSTYEDETGTFLATVGIAAFPTAAQASAAQQALSSPQLAQVGNFDVVAPGVQAAAFPGTPAAGFDNARRQLSATVLAGPYVVMYTVGYADNRPKVQVDVDDYTYSEMLAIGLGLADKAGDGLTTPAPVPHCPGSPGC